MFKCWFVEKKEKEQDKDITDKKSEKAKKNWRKLRLMLAKATRKISKCFFSSQKVTAGQSTKPTMRGTEVWQNADWIGDGDWARLKLQSSWWKDNPTRREEGSLSNLIDDARLVSSNGSEARNLETYKCNFWKMKKEFWCFREFPYFLVLGCYP